MNGFIEENDDQNKYLRLLPVSKTSEILGKMYK